MNEQELIKLYNALLSKGYTTQDIGDVTRFTSKMADASNRKQLFDYVSSRGDFRIGDYASYEERLTGKHPKAQQPAYNGDFTMPESELEGKKPEAQPLNIPSVADVMENRPKFQPKPILEKEVVTDEEGNRVRRPKLQQTMTGGRMSETPVVRDIYGNEYDQTSPETQEMVEEQITPVAPDVNKE